MSRFSFRGKTLKGDWVIGNLAVITKRYDHCGIFKEPGFYISNSVGAPFAYAVRPETIGQSTGLIDCDGKEIFEGDVIQWPEKCPIEVIWDNEHFSFCLAIKGKPRYEFDNSCAKAKITSNIHREV